MGQLYKQPDSPQEEALAIASLYAFCGIYYRQAPTMRTAAAPVGFSLTHAQASWLARLLKRTLLPSDAQPRVSLELQLAAIRVALRIDQLKLAARWAATLDARAVQTSAPLAAAWEEARSALGARAAGGRQN